MTMYDALMYPLHLLIVTVYNLYIMRSVALACSLNGFNALLIPNYRLTFYNGLNLPVCFNGYIPTSAYIAFKWLVICTYSQV
jgi:hypothetical protein